MREVPLEVFLSFPPPNYDNPVTRGDALTITHGVFMGIVISVVGVRLYTRLAINRRLGWDDIWIIPATIFTVALAALVILSHTKYNWNKHIYDVPPSQIPQLGKTAMAAKTLFTLAAVFTRQSLLSFYYRLIGETSLKHFRNVLHAATVFNVVTGIVFVALCLFPCRPISAYWDFPAHGHCLDDGKTTLGAGIVNCICDLLTTTLPIPIIMQLRMPLKHRLGVAFLLSLGFIVTIAGIVRSFYVWKSMMASYDETWYSYPLWIAGVVEIDLAVVCTPC
ncbi:hypothetical protein EJ06DRAFT_472675 [Trichodelitschia bisporula]|uniref:Rhodopsin domain-containing protein n=1 Tax=Trichodelitschia bisporula TaxID=703511 RepID=A0A6G1I393_9PEZI|nr:hypothetical protein EJ06DRAFT_472675 [Trichodelitschia bisporula]